MKMENNNSETLFKKRSAEEAVENNEQSKKIKRFSAKEFRKQLNQDSRHTGIYI